MVWTSNTLVGSRCMEIAFLIPNCHITFIYHRLAAYGRQALENPKSDFSHARHGERLCSISLIYKNDP